MDKSEATRLAQICLPKILGSAYEEKEVEEGIADVQFLSICQLWAGMGHIYLVTSTATTTHQFIIKRVLPPSRKKRNEGDKRKAESYIVEANFYKHLAPKIIKECGLLLPMPYHIEQDNDDDRITICMSYLGGSMSPLSNNKDDAVYSVLSWLATFHAATWSTVVDHNDLIKQRIIQPIGSYWHLTTRRTEHANMSTRGWEGRLKLAACAINERLQRDTMQCCIHGDAKESNMLFIHKDVKKKKGGGSRNYDSGSRNYDGGGGITIVGMYDYQYCGKAPPTVDLAYYFCVSTSVQTTNRYREYMQYYHQQLLSKLNCQDSEMPQHKLPTLVELEESLELALADFQRFLCGWGSWGSDISLVVIRVLNRLDGGTILASEDEYRLAMLREYG